MKHFPSTRSRRRRGPRPTSPVSRKRRRRGATCYTFPHFQLIECPTRRTWGSTRRRRPRCGRWPRRRGGNCVPKFAVPRVVDLARPRRVGLLRREEWTSGFRFSLCGGRRFGSARRCRRGVVHPHGAVARRNSRRFIEMHELATVTIFTPRRRPRS